MKKPFFDFKTFNRSSECDFDIILDHQMFGQVGQVVVDLNGNSYTFCSFYLGDNSFGFYVVACDQNDPCRIAYELGELSKEDFWSRFGFVWSLIPTPSGSYHVERVEISQVCCTVKFMWKIEIESPKEIAYDMFAQAFAAKTPSRPSLESILEKYPRFLEALAIRKQQWATFKRRAA